MATAWPLATAQLDLTWWGETTIYHLNRWFNHHLVGLYFGRPSINNIRVRDIEPCPGPGGLSWWKPLNPKGWWIQDSFKNSRRPLPRENWSYICQESQPTSLQTFSLFQRKTVQRQQNKSNRKAKISPGVSSFNITNQPPPLTYTYPPSETAGFNSPAIFTRKPCRSQVSMDVGPLSAAGWCLSPGHPVKLSHFWWVTSWGVEVGEFFVALKMDMDVSKNRVFPYKPSILGYHYFRKHPIWKKR